MKYACERNHSHLAKWVSPERTFSLRQKKKFSDNLGQNDQVSSWNVLVWIKELTKWDGSIREICQDSNSDTAKASKMLFIVY